MKTTAQHRRYSKEYYWAHREKCLEYHRNYHRNRSEENKERRRAHNRKRYRENIEYEHQRKKLYFAQLSSEQKERRRNYWRKSQRARRQRASYRLEDSLRRRLNKALRGQAKYKSVLKLLGCSIENFKLYLESKFEVGMSWDNYGFGKGKWNVDHVIPCVLFDLSRPEHQRRCFHFSNHQPLWQVDNFKKGARVTNPQLRLL